MNFLQINHQHQATYTQSFHFFFPPSACSRHTSQLRIARRRAEAAALKELQMYQDELEERKRQEEEELAERLKEELKEAAHAAQAEEERRRMAVEAEAAARRTKLQVCAVHMCV
jgi:signal transduction histidine kinase